MEKTLAVVFDGEVLRPESPLDLQPNRRYVITIKNADVLATGGDAWDVLEEQTGAIEAPADWAAEHDHYLYGTPKRQSQPAP